MIMMQTVIFCVSIILIYTAISDIANTSPGRMIEPSPYARAGKKCTLTETYSHASRILCTLVRSPWETARSFTRSAKRQPTETRKKRSHTSERTRFEFDLKFPSAQDVYTHTKPGALYGKITPRAQCTCAHLCKAYVRAPCFIQAKQINAFSVASLVRDDTTTTCWTTTNTKKHHPSATRYIV